MKKTLIKKITCLAVLGAALAWASGTARAQVTTNFFTFSGSADGLTYPGGWALQGDGSGYDPAVDNTGDGGGSYIFTKICLPATSSTSGVIGRAIMVGLTSGIRALTLMCWIMWI